jgi:hypothetical protein
MNSTTFSLLANNSAEVDENQEMELTIGSLSILIGPSGSSRLSDPTKQDPSASEPETVAMMEYSDGSSSEVNSPVSLDTTRKTAIGRKLPVAHQISDALRVYTGSAPITIRYAYKNYPQRTFIIHTLWVFLSLED